MIFKTTSEKEKFLQIEKKLILDGLEDIKHGRISRHETVMKRLQKRYKK